MAVTGRGGRRFRHGMVVGGGAMVEGALVKGVEENVDVLGVCVH